MWFYTPKVKFYSPEIQNFLQESGRMDDEALPSEKQFANGNELQQGNTLQRPASEGEGANWRGERRGRKDGSKR